VRNTLMAAAALGLLLATAACSSGDPAPASAQAAAPSVDPRAAASADAALSQDSKAICAQADRTGTTFGDTFIADLKLQLDAKNKGAQAKAEAKQKISQDVSNYSYALADMSKLASDAKLKSALKQMSDQVTAFAGDVSKINADQMSRLSDTLDRACGKG
jgi:hypothetical protein